MWRATRATAGGAAAARAGMVRLARTLVFQSKRCDRQTLAKF